MTHDLNTHLMAPNAEEKQRSSDSDGKNPSVQREKPLSKVLTPLKIHV